MLGRSVINRKITLLCLCGAVIYSLYYFYGLYYSYLYSQEVMDYALSMHSPIWFSMPDNWYLISYISFLIVYGALAIGFYWMKWIYLVLLSIFMLSNLSSAYVVVFGMDGLLFDLWRVIDGLLIATLFWGSSGRKPDHEI